MEQRKFQMPTAYTILFCLILLVALSTWFIPAGSYDYADGIPISGSYHAVAPAPQGIGAALKAAFRGFYDAVDVCVFILMVGGFLGVVMKTGAIDAGVSNVISRLQGRENLLITILMLFFGLGGTTYGMCEETVPFYLLLAATMVAAGFDSLTGAAVVLLGAGCGVLGSTVNPFAVGVAVDALSGIGIAVNQGIIIALGAILWLTTTIISIIFVMRYAKKVKADKGSTFLSLQEQQDMMNEWGMTDSEAEAADGQEMAPKMSGRQKATLIVFALTFVIMIVSFIPWEDLGFDGFVAGQSYEEVTTTMTGEEVASFIEDNDSGSNTQFSPPSPSPSRPSPSPRRRSLRLGRASSPAFLWASGTSMRPPPGSS